MATFVELPQMTDTMTDGVLSRKIVAEGESVRVGDAIAEIETDKAVMELEAPEDGILHSWRFAENAEIPCGDIVAIIGSVGEEIPVPRQEAASNAVVTEEPPSERVKASPVARKIARESGIDLAKVSGTGPDGRVVRRDVEAVAEMGGSKAEGPQPETSRISISRNRRIMIDRLVDTHRNVPTFTVTRRFDMDHVVEFLRQMRHAHKNTCPIGYTEILVKAAALASTREPALNARYGAEGIDRLSDVNIGVAIGLDDGVVVPVIRSCQSKSLGEIAEKLKEKTERAKRGALLADDVQGSTFTLSNLGMFGIDEFQAILNAPDAAILAVGAVAKQPVVRGDSVAIGTVMTGTLTVDHRVADGVTAAKWMAASGALRIAWNSSIPNIPKLDRVNVLP